MEKWIRTAIKEYFDGRDRIILPCQIEEIVRAYEDAQDFDERNGNYIMLTGKTKEELIQFLETDNIVNLIINIEN